MDEESIQRMAGTISCLTLVMQILIAKHPQKQVVVQTLEKLGEDAPTMMAMNHPGRPMIDKSFRDTLAVMIKAAQDSE